MLEIFRPGADNELFKMFMSKYQQTCRRLKPQQRSEILFKPLSCYMKQKKKASVHMEVGDIQLSKNEEKETQKINRFLKSHVWVSQSCHYSKQC